jgi:hypothetical protein
VIIDSFTSLEPSRTTPSAGIPAQIGNRSRFGPLPDDANRRVWQELRKFLQRALCLGDRAHLDPVAENHDRHERGQLPPQVHSLETERHREAEAERDGDRQGNEGHHSRSAVGQLADRSLDEDPAAVREDEGAEQRGYPA